MIDTKDELTSFIPWDVNGKDGLEMIQPIEFLPDVNESESRIIDSRIYTYVDAQLMGASKWSTSVKGPHLFSTRSSKEEGNSQILFYNQGIGFGYCHCIECGKIVMETKVHKAGTSTLQNIPAGFNNRPKEKDARQEEGKEVSPYHYNVGYQKQKKGVYCHGSRDPKKVHRNVVIADTITTDYTEIKIRYANSQDWIDKRDGSTVNFLTTLAILFTQSLAEYLGKDRDAFGFAVTPNGHICIFDTNPGGAGYSNHLASIDVMKSVIDMSLQMVEKAIKHNSKEILLDKFTSRFLDKIDMESARAWLFDETSNRDVLPEEIKNSLETASERSPKELKETIINSSNGNVTLFFRTDFDSWNYGSVEEGWYAYNSSLLRDAKVPVRVCVVKQPGEKLPAPIRSMLRNFVANGIKIYETENAFSEEVYPVVSVDGSLFVSNVKEACILNEYWASGSLFSAPQKDLFARISPLELVEDISNSKVFYIDDESSKHIKESRLIEIIEESAKDLIDRFVEESKTCDDKLEVLCMDKHTKSPLGILLTLKFMDYFINKTGKDFHISFKFLAYHEQNKGSSLIANMETSTKRDKYLREQLENLIYHEMTVANIEGTYDEKISYDKGELPHWRELSFRSGGKILRIMPDGGFINGWYLDDKSHKWKYDEVDFTQDFPLRRVEPIKYSVSLESIS